ncbi:unnamed protein product [Protopolystoma xenopodis]|uniref:Uncharacterized protein n=1 Tax=Protopolystoma xenopodis TaxID=117903 RepID=A0A448WQ43_9PLAT|nr:unnamed protein product [Protopolystoma xenopodis]
MHASPRGLDNAQMCHGQMADGQTVWIVPPVGAENRHSQQRVIGQRNQLTTRRKQIHADDKLFHMYTHVTKTGGNNLLATSRGWEAGKREITKVSLIVALREFIVMRQIGLAAMATSIHIRH